jgi:hypothetical protein
MERLNIRKGSIVFFLSNLGNQSNHGNQALKVTVVTARLPHKKGRIVNNHEAFRAFRLPGYHGYRIHSFKEQNSNMVTTRTVTGKVTSVT